MSGKAAYKKGAAVPKETEQEMLARLNKKLQEKGLSAAAKEMIQKQITDIMEAGLREAARVKAVEEARAAGAERNAAGAAGGCSVEAMKVEDALAAREAVRKEMNDALAAVKKEMAVVRKKRDASFAGTNLRFNLELAGLGAQESEITAKGEERLKDANEDYEYAKAVARGDAGAVAKFAHVYAARQERENARAATAAHWEKHFAARERRLTPEEQAALSASIAKRASEVKAATAWTKKNMPEFLNLRSEFDDGVRDEMIFMWNAAGGSLE
uniref:Uncharacterized protein n=1 Tax=viral metagenome TaxID=1070528 RepID=A0A6C0HGU5_9ZZZZ